MFILRSDLLKKKKSPPIFYLWQSYLVKKTDLDSGKKKTKPGVPQSRYGREEAYSELANPWVVNAAVCVCVCVWDVVVCRVVRHRSLR